MTGEPALSRRAVLRWACAGALSAATLSALSACTSSGQQATRRRPGSATTNAPADTTAPADTAAPVVTAADVKVLARALADERELLAYCTKVAARHPPLGAELAPVRRLQRRHVAVMQRALRATDDGRSASHVRVPRRAVAARAELVRSVRRIESRRLADCLAAESGLLARLFAATSASHAATGEMLAGQR